MFILEPLFAFPIQSESLHAHIELTKKILQKIIPDTQIFKNKENFVDWMEKSLPMIKWADSLDAPDALSIYVLCHDCRGLNVESFVLDLFKRRLVPDREIRILSFQHMLFHLKDIQADTLFIAELKVLVEDNRDLHYIQKNLPMLVKELTLGLTSAPYANYLLSSRNLSASSKMTLIHQELHQVMRKYPNHIDILVFDELARLNVKAEPVFLNQRKSRHISRIICASYLLRKEVFRATAIAATARHLRIKMFRASLFFPFSTKSVLGLLIGVNLMDKYELFDEDHVLAAIQKWIPQAQLVQGSSVAFEGSKDRIKILYVEIEKKDRSILSIDEMQLLNSALKGELRHRVEKLVPAIFMIRNEEEVLRNILTLSREIHKVDDLPQVMISLDRQTNSDVSFIIILVWVVKEGSRSLATLFEQNLGSYFFHSDRIQTVGYLKKNYPIEANVFYLSLNKGTAFFRADSSLNFYAARQEVSSILRKVIGEHRDYNGGIIVKQGEILSRFQQSFQEVAKTFPDLLENFFYSITPIERQATLSSPWLNKLFELFLSELKTELIKRSSYSLKLIQDDRRIYIIIRAKEASFKNVLSSAIAKNNLGHSLVTTQGFFQGIYFVGYIVEDLAAYAHFHACITNAMNQWQEKIDALNILRLGLQFSIVSLDPRIAGDEVSANLIRLLFEGLMRYTPSGKLDYGIAESVHISNRGKTYIFSLRKACWNNKIAVNAYDFEYSWKKILSPNFKTLFATLFYPIKNAKAAKEGLVSLDEVGVKATDSQTLRVDLVSPTPYFLELTTHTQFLPVNHQIDQLHPNWALQSGDNFVGNGAYNLRTNNPAHGYELIKNPEYWDKQNVNIDQVILSRMSAYHGRQMFKKGEVDWIGHPFGSWDLEYPKKDGGKILQSSDVCAYWYVFNTQRFPFHHIKLRRAFALALNQYKILEALPQIGIPAQSPLTK
jgi:oligopeptide transport system substrate-binding protein